jgi:hypothetical protein
MHPIPVIRLLPATALLALATAALPPLDAAEATAPVKKVREPAVAGLFYPQDPAGLSKMLASFLQAAPSRRSANSRR